MMWEVMSDYLRFVVAVLVRPRYVRYVGLGQVSAGYCNLG